MTSTAPCGTCCPDTTVTTTWRVTGLATRPKMGICQHCSASPRNPATVLTIWPGAVKSRDGWQLRIARHWRKFGATLRALAFGSGGIAGCGCMSPCSRDCGTAPWTHTISASTVFTAKDWAASDRTSPVFCNLSPGPGGALTSLPSASGRWKAWIRQIWPRMMKVSCPICRCTDWGTCLPWLWVWRWWRTCRIPRKRMVFSAIRVCWRGTTS
mmetsp:Transcript_74069/g.169672  ORF Transcript_74069/g.169672 Transcript_74069/m.169672 type:complete len:212 (+) Transcript_74069:926-1561(+)